MAKLDDFGRPIYETAEEYNRAHKGGVCPRPYDNSQKHATVATSKKAKPMVIGIAVFFLVLNTFIIVSVFSSLGFNDFEINQDYAEEWVDPDEGYYIGTDEYPLPEGFDTFYLNLTQCYHH